ncbi:MAG: GNAT family protein [Thermoplasmata archaeon]
MVPLQRSHAEPLSRAGSDPDIWRYLVAGFRGTPELMRGFIEELLTLQGEGSDLPFATLWNATDEPVGMTRFLDIDRRNASVEIGGTWVTPALRRTPVNTEAKLLRMTHAFETEGVHRVYLRTDLRNERSQRAIERLGTVREGVLREHIRMPDGYRRSSVYYSALRPEWPALKRRLLGLLERPWHAPEGTILPHDPRP